MVSEGQHIWDMGNHLGYGKSSGIWEIIWDMGNHLGYGKSSGIYAPSASLCYTCAPSGYMRHRHLCGTHALPLDIRLTITPRACVGPHHKLKQCLSRLWLYNIFFTVRAFVEIDSPRAFVEIESPLARAFVAFYSMINSIVWYCWKIIGILIIFIVSYRELNIKKYEVATYNEYESTHIYQIERPGRRLYFKRIIAKIML